MVSKGQMCKGRVNNDKVYICIQQMEAITVIIMSLTYLIVIAITYMYICHILVFHYVVVFYHMPHFSVPLCSGIYHINYIYWCIISILILPFK